VNTVINTAVFLLGVGATAWVGPALDEIAEKTYEAQEHIKQQQQQRRMERAAQEMCGNGVAQIEETTVTCKVRKALRGKRA